MNRDLAITLAGGGNRAFYQLGLLSRWWPRLESRIGAMSTCSAGACVALMLLSGRAETAFAFWHRRRGHVRRNLDWTRLLRGERPAPHYPVYRDTLLFALADGGFERLQAQPFPVYALVAVPPHPLPIPLAVPIGLGAYSLERWLNPGRLHPGSGRRLGFEPIARDLRLAASPEAVAELILASSATPPFTPVGRVDGRPVLDGGLVDNAPAFVAERERIWPRHLVVLTRPYPASVMGERGNRWYLCPSEPPPADRWDYTRPERITRTIALGERDADRFGARLDAWLSGGR
ncbi:MAG: patatin-like phospholipase family protein [Gemmatimonadales bacterium]|nr:patatin-like phospholipase family protein [Gemmatimonadales bacterium]